MSDPFDVDPLNPEHPLSDLSDEDLVKLGKDVGLEVTLPSLVTASDLLPPEPEIPQEPADEDTPPDEVSPTFIYIPDAYGKGNPSVKLADGTPVGRWLDSTHPDFSGQQVEDLLVAMGLEEIAPGRAAFFRKQRDKGLVARQEIADNPAMARFAAEELRRKAEKEKVQAAFIEAQRKKERK